MNILLALHYKIVRDGITKILAEDSEISVIDTAKNREELCSYDSKGKKVDVVVLDLDIPDLESLSTIRKILEAYSDTYVLL